MKVVKFDGNDVIATSGGLLLGGFGNGNHADNTMSYNKTTVTGGVGGAGTFLALLNAASGQNKSSTKKDTFTFIDGKNTVSMSARSYYGTDNFGSWLNGTYTWNGSAFSKSTQ